MKKSLLFLTLLLTTAVITSAQCVLQQDSVSSGDNATEHENYFYNAQGKINKVTRIDPGQTLYYTYDSLVYNGTTGYLDFRYRMDVGIATPRDTTAYVHNGSGQITRVNASGVSGDGEYWAMSHDVVYNSSGNVTNIILDISSVVGSPEGMEGSFLNMVWTAGNVTSVDLVFKLGGEDMALELIGLYDTKNNFERHTGLSEASDLLWYYSTNNMLNLTFVNDEPAIGASAGDKAIERTYTYNANDEVLTTTNVPAVFDGGNSENTYRYDCTTAVNAVVAEEKTVSIYPNPATDKLNISSLSNVNEIEILNVTGKVIYSTNVNSTTFVVNTSNFSRGLYFVRVASGNEMKTYKFIKE
jgi:hypothetical protein